jgi:hypothetical protein
MKTDKFALDYLVELSNQYFESEKGIQFYPFQPLESMDVTLYHIAEITFEEKSPRKEALENVISALTIEGINFIYLILGDKKGVHFYFGVAKDLYSDRELDLEIHDIGEFVLKPSLEGNFRGSVVSKIKSEEKRDILGKIKDMSHNCILEGVPGINKDDEHFQGVDRLVDVMLGDEFGLMIIAKPLDRESILKLKTILIIFMQPSHHIRNEVSKIPKIRVQGLPNLKRTVHLKRKGRITQKQSKRVVEPIIMSKILRIQELIAVFKRPRNRDHPPLDLNLKVAVKAPVLRKQMEQLLIRVQRLQMVPLNQMVQVSL